MSFRPVLLFLGTFSGVLIWADPNGKTTSLWRENFLLFRRRLASWPGNVAVGVEGESCGVVTQQAGACFHIYTILQCQRCEGVAESMETNFFYARFNTLCSILRTLSGEIGPPVGEENTYSEKPFSRSFFCFRISATSGGTMICR